MNYINNKIFTKSAVIFIALFFSLSHAQDSLYYKTFVKNADGSVCRSVPPNASYTAFINNDLSRVLTENNPRRDPTANGHIDGNASGLVGIDLANFSSPKIETGDTLYFRFTDLSTGQQNILVDGPLTITYPFFVFPKNLQLLTVDLPAKPDNLYLEKDSLNGNRVITWDEIPNGNFWIYRRDNRDTIHTGQSRNQYELIAQDITENIFIDNSAEENGEYGYIVYNVNEEGIFSSHSEEVNEIPLPSFGDDITISYIQRLPVIEYVWGSSNPDVEGWPSSGEPVFWHAVVKNWFTTPLYDVKYKWYLDNVIVDSGHVDIMPYDTAHVVYPWMWTFDRHKLKFVIDSDDQFLEEEEENNQLTVYTDAITVGFWVEQGVYDYFREHQRDLGVNSNCWEDWAQRHVKRWNFMLENAVYPTSPEGALDRIRIDKITIVDDYELPLNGGLPTNNPDINDRTIDLQWGFVADQVYNSNFYSNTTSVSDNNPFYFEGSLFHELGHARYLIDVYGFNVHDDGTGNTVAIKENGSLIIGTEYMPFVSGDGLYLTPRQDLMYHHYTMIGEYSAAALNLIDGHRAILGNYNAPGNIGVFLPEMPEENRFLIKGTNETILPGANVRVYQAVGQGTGWYTKHFDNTADITVTADENGYAYVGHNPFNLNSSSDHGYGVSKSIIIIRVEYNGEVEYHFKEVAEFNLAYWGGNTELGTYELETDILGVVSVKDDKTVLGYELRQNYPNPFNPSTTIEYSLKNNSFVTLKIFNAMGELVKVLVNGNQQKGNYSAEWNGDNLVNNKLSSGIYFYQLTTEEFTKTNKMILLK
ncbi:MAG: T9SS type A sorting domain-containing protein [Melioribacteraceae bacterium]|nr:T9SS type A sorting domain-containing protein [Melioribacteraceae bacterium]MCF8353148.1 T9SS type A sorting domain-containing protein [Melioribacteraceae bacterium]MCF8393152.1 T9SS type A sorting domain-containing protein [Melioribacteraceae bacterium]MCF8418055.1 T9SS type A sorting domain-containing protein [Melioribacteraceae bacterium]